METDSLAIPREESQSSSLLTLIDKFLEIIDYNDFRLTIENKDPVKKQIRFIAIERKSDGEWQLRIVHGIIRRFSGTLRALLVLLTTSTDIHQYLHPLEIHELNCCTWDYHQYDFEFRSCDRNCEDIPRKNHTCTTSMKFIRPTGEQYPKEEVLTFSIDRRPCHIDLLKIMIANAKICYRYHKSTVQIKSARTAI